MSVRKDGFGPKERTGVSVNTVGGSRACDKVHEVESNKTCMHVLLLHRLTDFTSLGAVGHCETR